MTSPAFLSTHKLKTYLLLKVWNLNFHCYEICDLFFIAYWNIQMFMSISMYRWAISEHEKWTNFPSKIWIKPGSTCEIFRRHVLGLWRLKYDTTSDHNKKTHNEQAKVGKYLVFLVRSFSLFSRTLPSWPIRKQ